MAKSRTIATNLSRVFDSSPALVYVIKTPGPINSENESPPFPTIVYANRACLDWVGIEFADLKDARLIYSSQPTDHAVENNIRGLAPPCIQNESNQKQPISWTEEFQIFSSTDDKTIAWRTAIAKKITPDSDNAPFAFENWLVIAEPPDNPQPPTLKAHERPFFATQLHNEIAKLNNRSAARHSLANLVGVAPSTAGLRRAVAAAIQSPQLDLQITGPKGSGREHLARTIFHQRTRTQPGARLIPLHCAIADQQLVQQNIKELAINQTAGQPVQDCLLLLDVDQLSPTAQTELVGFLELTTLNIHSIATATQRLTEIDGFHPLLAQRLGTLTLPLPPLCDRMEDVPLLAQALVEQHNTKSPFQVAGFTPAAMQMLLDYSWPGNLDQLLDIVTAAAESAHERMIETTDFPPFLKMSIRASQLEPPETRSIDLTDYLEQIESQLMERALTKTNGNKTQACKLLNISRPRLLRRLKQLQLFQWLEADPNRDGDEQIDSSAFKEAEE